MKFTDQDIDAFLEDLDDAEGREHFKSPLDVVDRMFDEQEQPQVFSTFGTVIEFHPGELTIWAGDGGSGKSLLVGDAINEFLLDANCAIASLEMPLHQTLRRMMTQSLGRAPDVDEANRWARARNKSLWLYDQIDTVPADRIVAMVNYAHRRLECRHVVIDSLTKCGLPQDGSGFLTAQTRFVDTLQHLVKHLGVHVHLVAHLRKGEAGRRTKHDIRGASQITDMADRVLLLSRNIDKERVMEQAGRIPEQYWTERFAEKFEKAKGQADAIVQCEKQRSDGFIGDVRLMFDRASLKHVNKRETA